MKHLDRMAGWVAKKLDGKKVFKGSTQDIVWTHNETYPQHPLCLKRNYWRVTLEAKRGKIDEPYLEANFYLCNPGEEDYLLLYTVKIEEGELGPEQTECTYHFVSTVNLFDLVTHVFGDSISDYWKKEGEVHVFILVEEILHMDDDFDWEIIQELVPRATLTQRSDDSWELEVIQIIYDGNNKDRKYIPMTKYPQP